MKQTKPMLIIRDGYLNDSIITNIKTKSNFVALSFYCQDYICDLKKMWIKRSSIKYLNDKLIGQNFMYGLLTFTIVLIQTNYHSDKSIEVTIFMTPYIERKK